MENQYLDIKNTCIICDNHIEYNYKLFCGNCVNYGFRKCIGCNKFNINMNKPYWYIRCKNCINK